MQKELPNQHSENEVELGNFTNRISGFFDSILAGLFKFIQLLYRNKWITLALIALGIGLGILSTLTSKRRCTSEIIVATDYTSTEHVDAKIKGCSAIKAAASNPQHSILFTSVKSRGVEPVYNAFDFLLSNYQRREAFRILTER